jgi:hypothetical protein
MAETSIISVGSARECPRNVANSAVILVDYCPNTAVDFYGGLPTHRHRGDRAVGCRLSTVADPHLAQRQFFARPVWQVTGRALAPASRLPRSRGAAPRAPASHRQASRTKPVSSRSSNALSSMCASQRAGSVLPLYRVSCASRRLSGASVSRALGKGTVIAAVLKRRQHIPRSRSADSRRVDPKGHRVARRRPAGL